MIRTVNGMVLRKSQDQEVEIAQFFEDSSRHYAVLNSLEKTIRAGRIPATAPQILQLRIDCGNRTDELFSKFFIGMSEIDIVEDNYYLTHGGLYFKDPERIRKALEEKEGLVEKAARLTQEESSKLKEEKTGTRIITYEQFLEETEREDITTPYTIKVERRLLAKLKNGKLTTNMWAEDPRAIMYSGSKARAKAYAEKLEISGIADLWLNIDKETAEDRAYLLSCGNYIDDGLSGSSDISDGIGRFLGFVQKISEAH